MKDEKEKELVDKSAFAYFGKAIELVDVEKIGLYKDGFLAGLKAGRPQRHDLRKDPTDLPKEEKIVLIFIEGGIKLIDCYDKYRGWHTYSKAKIIAWCEIPTFDKEEA